MWGFLFLAFVSLVHGDEAQRGENTLAVGGVRCGHGEVGSADETTTPGTVEHAGAHDDAVAYAELQRDGAGKLDVAPVLARELGRADSGPA